MSAITISRESGSRGGDLARSVALKLGWHLVDKDTIGAILRQYGFVEFEQEYNAVPGFWANFDGQRGRRKVLVEMLNQVLLALARHGGVVLLGRGGCAVLGDFADVLNVRVQAPRSLRVQEVMRRQGFSDSERAEILVSEEDRVRKAFLETYYGLRWDDPCIFDMVIDTGKIPLNLATDWLAQAPDSLKKQKVSEANMTASIKVDPLLASTISNELKCDAVRH
jgi:cytidylate kinase